jgi:lipopolysaccharide biosynthesis regulator YciM
MDTIIIIILLAVVVSLAIFIYYGQYKKEKRQPDDRLYIEALRALLDNRDEEAFSKFREVVAGDSSNIDAYLRLGDILKKYGKADKALQVHRDLTLRHNLKNPEKKSILRALTEDFLAISDNGSAEKALKELIAIDSSNRWAYENLLKLHEKTGHWDEAFEIKEKLIKIDGDHSKKGLAVYRYHQGEILFGRKEYHKARILFKEAISMDPACVEAYIKIGDSYVLEDRLDDAVHIWQKMVVAAPARAGLVLGRLKKALFELGRYGDISSVCNDILETAPDNLDARLLLADYHQKKGEVSEAIEHLRATVESHPEEYAPALELARLYLSTGNKKELTTLLDRLIERGETARKTAGLSKTAISSGQDVYSAR